ncbi:MAG: hypothetical protein R3A78_12165 [Polyangiales bacterium]
MGEGHRGPAHGLGRDEQRAKRAARQKLWEALTGANDDERKLAGLLLLDMPERGLLLRARDEGGPGGQLAGKLLRGDKD